MILIKLCILIGFFYLTKSKTSFMPNLPLGKYRIVFEKGYPCPSSTNSIQYNVYFSKKTSNITEMKGNFTYLIPLDDTLTLEINAASWSLIGGWKPNSMVYITKNACTSLKNFLGNAWDSIVEAYNMYNNSCPVLAGTYITSGIDVKKLEDHNFPKVYYYGKYKVLYKMRNVENQLVGCLAFELNLIRPWPVGNPNLIKFYKIIIKPTFCHNCYVFQYILYSLPDTAGAHPGFLFGEGGGA